MPPKRIKVVVNSRYFDMTDETTGNAVTAIQSSGKSYIRIRHLLLESDTIISPDGLISYGSAKCYFTKDAIKSAFPDIFESRVSLNHDKAMGAYGEKSEMEEKDGKLQGWGEGKIWVWQLSQDEIDLLNKNIIEGTIGGSVEFYPIEYHLDDDGVLVITKLEIIGGAVITGSNVQPADVGTLGLFSVFAKEGKEGGNTTMFKKFLEVMCKKAGVLVSPAQPAAVLGQLSLYDLQDRVRAAIIDKWKEFKDVWDEQTWNLNYDGGYLQVVYPEEHYAIWFREGNYYYIPYSIGPDDQIILTNYSLAVDNGWSIAPAATAPVISPVVSSKLEGGDKMTPDEIKQLAVAVVAAMQSLPLSTPTAPVSAQVADATNVTLVTSDDSKVVIAKLRTELMESARPFASDMERRGCEILCREMSDDDFKSALAVRKAEAVKAESTDPVTPTEPVVPEAPATPDPTPVAPAADTVTPDTDTTPDTTAPVTPATPEVIDPVPVEPVNAKASSHAPMGSGESETQSEGYGFIGSLGI